MLKTVSSITNALGALNYKGTWNASTNTPALASGVGTKGDYYVVSVAGSTALDGISIWGVGDWVAFNGTVWQRVDGGADGEFVNLSATGAVSFDGGAFVFNESGADKDARFEGDTNTALLFTDASTDRVGFNTSTPQAKTETYDENGQTIEKLRGNGLPSFQGEAEYMRVVRHCPVVSLGTKLIIPFVSQGSLWESTTVRVMGVGARLSNSTPLGFEVTFTVSHISALNGLVAWGGGGNYASIAVNGMNVEITFTTNYTSATQNGVFVMLEFITGRQNWSIDVANIVMN